MVLEAQDSINLPHYNIPTIVANDVFRAYDIRGPVEPDSLTADLSYAIGLAFGSEVREKQQTTVAVGRDGRLSGPELTRALMRGICDAGVDILDIGMVPTPLLYFATHQLKTNSGVMVTASHNPGHHNGFKIVLCGKTLTTEGIHALRERIVQRRFTQGQGKVTSIDVIQDYEKYVTDRIHLARPLKVVVDCGNGVAGNMVPNLYRKLGCEVIELYCDVDGRFPNHHPDPTVPENLTVLIDTVKKTQADLGLALDGDADRLGMVTDLGEIIWPDRQMMVFANDVLTHHHGATIIFDVKCTRHLPILIAQYGGKPIMWRTGHSILKAKLFELNAALAGEMSGHIFFNDEWFGFDDGIYVGARLLRILSEQTHRVSHVFAELPNSVNTPELKLPMAEDKKQSFMRELVNRGDFPGGTLITIDGLRVEFADSWGLIRPSNTSPYLILRFEADTEAGLENIKQLFRQQLLKIDAHLALPF